MLNSCVHDVCRTVEANASPAGCRRDVGQRHFFFSFDTAQHVEVSTCSV